MIKIVIITLFIVITIFIVYSRWIKNQTVNGPEYSNDERLNKMYIDIEADFDNPTTERFKNAFNSFIEYAENGNNNCAGMVAEVYYVVEPYRDFEKAYFWYYIYYAGQNGYYMEFDNQQESSHNYYGKIGDFRNESMVADLVNKLGFEKVKEIDIMSRKLLNKKANEK